MKHNKPFNRPHSRCEAIAGLAHSSESIASKFGPFNRGVMFKVVGTRLLGILLGMLTGFLVQTPLLGVAFVWWLQPIVWLNLPDSITWPASIIWIFLPKVIVIALVSSALTRRFGHFRSFLYSALISIIVWNYIVFYLPVYNPIHGLLTIGSDRNQSIVFIQSTMFFFFYYMFYRQFSDFKKVILSNDT